MFKALTGLIDGFFKPINAFFSKLTDAKLPAQGGDVLGRTPGKDNWGKEAGRLVDSLPDFAKFGTPTPLTPLLVPLSQTSIPTGPAPIVLAKNELAKEV